jgi:hypothetical protein
MENVAPFTTTDTVLVVVTVTALVLVPVTYNVYTTLTDGDTIKVGLGEVIPPGLIEYDGEVRLALFTAVTTVLCPKQMDDCAAEAKEMTANTMTAALFMIFVFMTNVLTF